MHIGTKNQADIRKKTDPDGEGPLDFTADDILNIRRQWSLIWPKITK